MEDKTENTAVVDELFSVLQDRAEIELAIRRISSGEASAADYWERFRAWKERATLFSACQMIRHDCAAASDFKAKIPAWIDSATPNLSAKMIRHGLASPEDFGRRLEDWTTHPQYSFWRGFAKAAPLADFGQLVAGWIAAATFESAMGLVEDGLASPLDFAPRVSSWADFGPKDRLQTMANLGLMSREDADDTRGVIRAVHATCNEGCRVSESLIRDCLQIGDGSSLHKLLEAGEICPADCADRIEEWLDEVTPESAPRLIRYGFATAEEVRARLSDRFGSLTLEQAYRLTPSGVFTKDDADKMRDAWRRTLSPDTIHMAYSLGVVSAEEALAMFRTWGDECMMEDPRFARLVRSKMDLGALVGKRAVGRFQEFREGGAVVRVNGFSGFVMQSEFAWHRAGGADCRFRWGDLVECTIHRFTKSTLLLRLEGNHAASRFPVGTVVDGTVSSVKDYGMFVDIAPGLRGFVFRGEVSWKHKADPMDELYKVGDRVEAVVTAIDEAERKITLSIRQLSPDPWKVAAEKCKPGATVKGKVVRKVGKFLIVEVSPEVTGFVHRNEVSWRDRDSMLAEPAAGYDVGDEVRAVVKSFDPGLRRLELSIKAALPSPWEGVEGMYPVGSVSKGVVVRNKGAFAFVEMPSGVTGMLHKGEIGRNGSEFVPYSVGDEVDVLVLYVSERLKSLVLSVRALEMSGEEVAALAEETRKRVEASPSRRARVPSATPFASQTTKSKENIDS